MIFDDVIYGTISIKDEPLCEIINHSIFRRLTQINVIPFPNPYFPRAIENKEYNHAIGVMQLVDIAEKYFPEIKEFSLSLKLASLLHYIIDRPIEEPSQRVERLVGIKLTKERLESAIYNTNLCEMIYKYHIESDFKRAMEINLEVFTEHKGIEVLFNSILSIKKFDYLLRDAYYTTQPIVSNLINVKKILGSISLDNVEGMIINYPIDKSIERYFSAYNIMFKEVYLHSKKNIIDAMYEKVYRIILENKFIDPIVILSSQQKGLPIFFKLNDNNILDYFENIAILNKELLTLIKKIKLRKLYTKIVSVKISSDTSKRVLNDKNYEMKITNGILQILDVDNPVAVIISIPMGEVVMEGLKKSNRNILYDNAPIMDSKTNEILIIRKMWENIQFLNVLVDEDIVKINNEKIKEIDYYINISINNETIY